MLEQGYRYFMVPCPEDGPRPPRDFVLKLPDVSLETYYERVRALRDRVKLSELWAVHYRDERFPIYRLDRPGSQAKRTALIVAGVHGNEICGPLGALEWLEKATQGPWPYEDWNVTVITPANPVGYKYESRYNANGCDVNRDFGAFHTPEARMIRDVFGEIRPDVIATLHEGPQDGFFVIATQGADRALAEAIARAVRDAGHPVATKSFVGFALKEPGLHFEGTLLTNVKRAIRIDTLDAYAHYQGVPTYTTETNWAGEDVGARIRSHVLTIETVLGKQT